ncbi:hypothetical protein EDC30_109121 [Paucimonas lemoignei]|uniref:Uncharacterized protein n=1 Tax=Paucimonas lemoignei TaxID=29443 RepID=A0A4R3HS46_PAULE|nr:hypothetical protein [Paucimonas lemoignei]TCS35822.1 hypothetical protein EDC30_109121 [Paucimonas lemoignei]
MILISDPTDVIGKKVSHQGAVIGTVVSIKPNMQGGRRYAFVKPYDEACYEHRLPLDELDLVREA